MDTSRDNPFYSNHVFSRADLQRARLRWHQKLWLWALPTFVQIGEGYAYHFKRDRWGRIFLMKVEALPCLKTQDRSV